ncbi:hypothetical protein FB45DRAFT_1011809 [Roridomyces roridus]|uniref:Uncharacterized protein n=1 Tax=Roridomyces roridus TaxID=1738132 RepID=A0AAD7B0E6_9AGAR|nr:hypothetical protein FB45DRAFT_1011809 [Roridomyces roridus]
MTILGRTPLEDLVKVKDLQRPLKFNYQSSKTSFRVRSPQSALCSFTDVNLPYKHFKLSKRLVYDQCTTQPKHEIPPKARSQRSPAAALAAHTLLHVQYASLTREVAPGQACAPSSSRRRSRAAQRRIRHASDVPKIQPYATTYCPPPPPRTSKAPSKQHLMAPSRSISQLSVGALGGKAEMEGDLKQRHPRTSAAGRAGSREMDGDLGLSSETRRRVGGRWPKSMIARIAGAWRSRGRSGLGLSRTVHDWIIFCQRSNWQNLENSLNPDVDEQPEMREAWDKHALIAEGRNKSDSLTSPTNPGPSRAPLLPPSGLQLHTPPECGQLTSSWGVRCVPHVADERHPAGGWLDPSSYLQWTQCGSSSGWYIWSD